MAKLTADTGLCQGYGNCLTTASDVYDIDDDGKVVLLTETIPDADRARVEAAARSCPVKALAVVDG
ncbi:ferredoxin [Amycolatopsis sp. FDAARGOS 1241]|uniref:ferredoxin n=1 Tax=Amycolatopsis sp. FDAARGOS 1241 TaxID=2778070 RepID=UPI0019520F88|nr:ferredoxin [Amycolatopsis sp. FDAARGOS 1241]QRP49471.1 ferredoxin [Amycolatopsis sp. FDAARGOS 1241]